MGPGAPTANVYSASGPGNNRNVNPTYDAAGNLTVFGSMSVSYDAENRQTAAGGTSYAYDGAGQRVKKVAASGTTVYVSDAFGQLVAEYASGPATGSPCGSTCYLSYDLLGSVRMVTDGQHNVIAPARLCAVWAGDSGRSRRANECVGCGRWRESEVHGV
jgi:YD repeat-containing protein